MQVIEEKKGKTEIERLMQARGIRDGVVYHRLIHLIDSGVYDGSVAELKKMLTHDDWRLVRLTNTHISLLKSLTQQRR